jgi:maleylacetate reductase
MRRRGHGAVGNVSPEIARGSSSFQKVGSLSYWEGLPARLPLGGNRQVRGLRSGKLNSVLSPDRLPRHLPTADITRCADGGPFALFHATTTGGAPGLAEGWPRRRGAATNQRKEEGRLRHAATPIMVETPDRFELTQRSHRVIFGHGVNEVLRSEIAGGGLGPYALIATAGMARRFESLVTQDVLASRTGTFSSAVPHVPEEVARRALDSVRTCGAAHILAFGGGSSLDTAKAVSHWLGLPIIAVPTNFSGSEVTWNFGLTSDGVKRTVLDPDVLPKTVIYDATLLSTLTPPVAASSGMNAIAHAIEGLYAINANPLSSAAALAGIRSLVSGLRARQDGEPHADTRCFEGSWLCAEVLSLVGMGLHHRICHVLGGAFGLPHAATHAVILPHAIDFNYDCAPALAALGDLFGRQSLAAGLATFSRHLGVPNSLCELGLSERELSRAAQLTLAAPLSNPRPVTVADVQDILGKAFVGQLPR